VVNKKKVIVGSLIGLGCVAVILAIVVAVVLTRSSGGTTAPSSSGTSLSVAWLFDNTTTDSTGNYNGYLVNCATYGVSTSIMPYLGQG